MDEAMIEEMAERVRQFTQAGNYIQAFRVMDNGLELNLPDTFKALLLRNRARLNMVLHRYADAQRDAQASFRYAPSYETIKLQMEIHLECRGPAATLHRWCIVYEQTFGSLGNILAIREIVLLMINHKDELDEQTILYTHSIPLNFHQEDLLVVLADENDWIAMAFMVLGLFPNKSTLCGAAKNCRTVNISVGRLLIRYKGRVKYWVDSLAAAIVKGGSSIEDLRQVCGQPPMHTTAEIAVQSGFFELHTVVAKLSYSYTKNKQGQDVFKYLFLKGYQSNPHYKRVISIALQGNSTPEEDKLKQEETLSEKARNAVHHRHYSDALQYYFQIIETLDKDDVTKKAKYYRNISLVYFYQKKYEESLEFAEKCLAIDRSLGKAYWRKAQVLQILNRPHLACHTYLTGLAHSEEPLDFLKQAVKQLENNVDQMKKYGFKECLPLFPKVGSALWSEFLCQAAKDAKWTRIKLVVLGPLNGAALAKDFDASNLSLSTLYDALKSEESLKKSSHMMLLKLLKNGAKIQTLSQNSDEALHILVKLVLFIESCDVLEYVLKRHPLKQTKEESMLLHTAVKQGNVDSECCFRVLQLLLQKGMNPKATDSSRKTASDYITEDFSKAGALLQIYTPDLELKSDSLKETGNKFFKSKNYEVACSYYTIGIALGQKEDPHFMAILYGNRCECFLKMGERVLAENDAMVSALHRPDWYKAHQRMSKVYLRDYPQLAYQSLYKAYSLLEFDTENAIRLKIVKELCMMNIDLELDDLSGMKFGDILLASLDLMKSNDVLDFHLARFIFSYIWDTYSPQWKIDTSLIDVSPFCSVAAIERSEPIFGQSLQHLLQTGADLRNLSVYKGDTYLHALSIMASRNGDSFFGLFTNVLDDRTERLEEINLVDSRGKTALFRIYNEPNSEFKERVIFALRDQGALMESSPEDYPPAKTLPENVYLTINDSARKTPSEKTRNSVPSQKRSSKFPSPAKFPLASKVDDMSTPVDPCSLHCEKLYNSSLKKQKSGADANKIFPCLVELCQKNHEGNIHNGWVSKSIDFMAEQLELSGKLAIPACLLSMKAHLFRKLVLKLASTKKWICMYQAFESYQQKNSRVNSLGSFAASTLTAADFLNSITFKEQSELHGKILTCLIENGATIGKDPLLEKTALDVCITNNGYRAIIILLQNGLDPSQITLSQGDTPLHAAAEIALRKDIGYFDLFEYLLQLYDDDEVKYSYLNISCVDKGLQTLYHVACRIKNSKHSLRLVEMLYKRGLSSDVPDAAGKIPYQYISQKPSDRRNGYLVRVSSETVPTETETQASLKSPTPSSWGSPTPMSGDEVAPKKRALPNQEMFKLDKKSSMKLFLKETILSMDDHKCKELHILTSFHKEDQKQVDKSRTCRAKKSPENTGDLKESSGSELDECEDVDLLNSNAFENLEWEVECTSDVWKTLHDENMPYKKRKQAVFKIQQLASGDWRPNSYKKVKDLPQTLKLYTIKLSRSSRIVWELAIAFSPRCSDVKRVSHGNDVDLESTQDQVYSEVIRVWAVIFDMKDLKHVQDHIIKSHTRGETCLVQKHLESIRDGKEHFGDGTKRLPRLFAEKQIDKQQLDLQRFCPPASDRDHEYHIIKFYSFSTALVSSVLQIDSSRSIDFPFQVTELEHRIINISSTAPIILLGRSGTGKTTCCLYRLWMNFVNYWIRAESAGAPLYPTHCVGGMRRIEADGGQQETETGEDAAEADSVDEKKDQFLENQSKEFSLEDEANPDSGLGSNVNPDGQVFTHLHQLFVTKNGVLCSEVLKNFRELSHGCEVASKSMGVEDLALPHIFQEITDNHFPLFMTSKKLWIVLDASLDPPYFFPRQKDGSLKSEVVGWSNEDDHLSFLPSLDDNYDDNEDDSFALPYEFLAPKSQAANQRKEVTYEVFLQLWQEINKPHSEYHPSLVWTEIISFIKGSFEALNTKKGFLSQEQYISIGRKRAPNFNGERDKVYELFLRYQRQKRQKGMFDESDVVFNLYTRLQRAKQIPCPLHEIYVDETQDFTQAELCLLIQLSENPNQMFLTGDTAQSIMRGVSFRFSDLKSLFFYAQEHSGSSAKRPQAIRCPKSLYELPHNYRSHQGILKLASSVIDLLSRYFSDSFDPLKKDQGLFDGPKPKLLESCSLGNLAMLLRGNKRQSSHIEFGAHQVILVVNNESREKLPEELSTGLVLTIFEAKGLEFDDVLLYNFFQDSQASKEWRVVTEFLQELVNKQNPNDDTTNQDNLLKINMDVFQEANRPRPLAFNSNLHKILNSELKLLYTALTRARVNLWIFDADINKRAPMFDYFKTLDLVEPVNTENLEEKDVGELIFAEHSTPEMWLQRGDELSRRSLYEIAAKCYRLGGHVQQETTAQANHQALTAQRCPDLQKQKEHFMMAAKLYMDCNQHIKAAKCLANAKEKMLSTQLFEKCQEYEIAGMNYLRLQYPLKASQCFEIIQQYDRTVDILHDNKMYDRAIDAIQRYNFLVKSYGEEDVPEILLKHKPQKDFNYLCYRSADSHYKERNFDEMKSVLHQLPSVEKMEFLEKKHLIDLAADMLFEEGQLEQSVQLLRRNGKYEKCIELARSGTDEMLANCLYTFAQYKYVQLKQADESVDSAALQMETSALLEEAKACYQRNGDQNGYGLCLLQLAITNKDADSAAEALTKFLLIGPRPNVAGCLQSAEVLTRNVHFEEMSHTDSIMKTLELGYKLLKELKSAACTVSLSLREYLQHSGFHILNQQTVRTYPKLEPLVTVQLEATLTSTGSSHVDYPITEIKQMLHRRLLIVIERLFLWVRQSYMLHLSRSIQCPLYTAGYECQGADECTCPLQKIHLLCKRPTSGCLHRHEPCTEDSFKKAVTITTKLMLMDSELIRRVDEDDVASMKTLQSLFDKKNLYSISRLLVLLLMPIAGNGLPFKTAQHLHAMKKWFVSLQKCAVFIREYLSATCKRVKFHIDRLPNSMRKFHSDQLPNFFLESPVLNGLFDLEGNLKLWMKQLCVSAHHIWPDKIPFFGVLIKSKNMYFCIYERFLESLVYLHEKWDPFESLIKFTKYTTLLLQKDFPRLDVLLFWCEYYIVLALMLFLKSQKDLAVALPKTYVIHSFFIDCMQKDPNFSLQKAVQGSKPFDSQQIKTLWDRIEKLVELLFAPKIIKIAEKERHITSGVTERYIVLGLVFLSNSNRGVFADLVPKMIGSILKLDITAMMAPRLREALQKVRLSKGNPDSVSILTELLQRRGDSIGNYHWSYNPKTHQGLQCQFSAPNPAASFNSVDFERRSDQRQVFDDDDEYDDDDDEYEDESGFTESELNQAMEFQERAKAVSVISQAYLAYKFRCSCTHLAGKVSDYIARQSGNEVDYFSEMKLSEAGCNICGLSFATECALPSEMLLEAAMTEDEEYPSHAREDTQRTSEMKRHKEKSSHKGKEIELRRCVNKYRREFVPVVKKAQELLSNSEEKDLNPEIEYDLNKLTKTITKLDLTIIKMCKEASWGNLPSLETQLLELKGALATVDKKILRKKQIASAAENKVESNVLEDEELNDFVDTQDVVQEPRRNRNQTFHKQKNMKH